MEILSKYTRSYGQREVNRFASFKIGHFDILNVITYNINENKRSINSKNEMLLNGKFNRHLLPNNNEN